MSLIKSKETIKKFETGYRQIEKEISEMISAYQAEIGKQNFKKEEVEKRISEIKKVMEKPDLTLDEYTDAEIRLNASMKYLERVNTEISLFEDPVKNNRIESFIQLRDRASKLMYEENKEELESLAKYIISNLSDTAERQARIREGLKDLCSFLSISTVAPDNFWSRSYNGEAVETEIDQAEKMLNSINESRGNQ